MIKQLLRKVANGICMYGAWGAGMPSCHGIFEAEVPAELMDSDDQ